MFDPFVCAQFVRRILADPGDKSLIYNKGKVYEVSLKELEQPEGLRGSQFSCVLIDEEYPR